MHPSATVGALRHAAAFPDLLLAVLLAAFPLGAGGEGNELCWYNSGRTYEECCISERHSLEIEEACWTGTWFTEEFCCSALPPGYQQCFEDIERRVLDKIENLERWEAAVAGGGPDPGKEGEIAILGQHIMNYRILLARPLTLWNLACSFPDSPMLWSEGCSCCDPKDEVCRDDDGATIHPAHWQCCYPVYTRKTHGPPDVKLEAIIQAHLGSTTISRQELVERGSRQQWQQVANGCIISLRDGRVLPCDESHACPTFDCSYMRAFVLTLTIIQGIKPLPDMDLLLNPGDVTLDTSEGLLPTFTRVGTRWTNTIAIPPEWQLHPGQCFKHLMAAISAAEAIPWERRQSVLIWRGSNSNCRTATCNVALASDEGGSGLAMEACGRMERGQAARDCRWDLGTWLRMPRGRLVWLSRFSESIDARFLLSRHLPMDPELEEFLRGEDLIKDEPMDIQAQAHYKYAIAVEGDSFPDRVYWQLLTGSTLLLQDGPWQVYAVTGLLEPYVHYVPVRYDLGDLVDKVAWLRQNDEEARRIAQRGAAFARRHLTCDGIVYYVDRLLRAYFGRLTD